MKPSRTLSCALALLSLSSLAACSGGDGDLEGGATSAPPPGFKLTCTASTTPSRGTYTVEGDTLVLTDPETGKTGKLQSAVAHTGKSAIGTWVIPAESTGSGDEKLSFTGTIRIDANRVTVSAKCTSRWKTLNASASSPFELGETTVRTLESHEEIREWTAAGGERVVSKRSLGAAGAPAAAGVSSGEPAAVVVAFPDVVFGRAATR